MQVIEVVPNEKIVLEWGANEAEVGRNRREGHRNGLSHHGDDAVQADRATAARWWRSSRKAGSDTPGALRGSYNNCEGWTGMLCALKAWIEHGINLREGTVQIGGITASGSALSEARLLDLDLFDICHHLERTAQGETTMNN